MAADYGFVYCMGNPAMPGIYKIGMTEFAPSRRAAELSSSTSVPYDFEVLFYIEVPTPRKIEAVAHKEFSSVRVNVDREFFQADIAAIHAWFDIYKQDGCPMAMTRDGEFELGYHTPPDTKDLP